MGRRRAEDVAAIVEAGRRRGGIAVDIGPLRVGNILRDSYLGLLHAAR
ncbi:hypothetical protein [Streptomyces sp. NPDC046939]